MIIEEPQKREMLEQVRQEANPTAGQVGRPPRARRKREQRDKLRNGSAESIDRSWLLEQLLEVYDEDGIRPLDKLRALELMAKISGYGQRSEEPADERQALQDLMRDMSNDGKSR